MTAAFEAGQDRMAYDIGRMIPDLSAAGTSDGGIIVAVEDMIALRMELSLDGAASKFGESP